MKQLLIILTLLVPELVTAQGYETLVNIPGVSAGGGFDSYVNALYALSIGIAALLAVIKIVIAGVKLMMTDIVTTKGEAKKDIQGALMGLLIVLAAVLIIYVINPDILKVNLNLDSISESTSSGVVESGPSTGARISTCLMDDYVDNPILCGCPVGYVETTKQVICPTIGCVGKYQLICAPDSTVLPTVKANGLCDSVSSCHEVCRDAGGFTESYDVIDVRYRGEGFETPYEVSCGGVF